MVHVVLTRFHPGGHPLRNGSGESPTAHEGRETPGEDALIGTRLPGARALLERSNPQGTTWRAIPAYDTVCLGTIGPGVPQVGRRGKDQEREGGTC